ncbi:hypothetical protein PENFLA_c084G01908 [Penicillium flavigenum]|uniref:DUF7703 domain-containing protein n=1 Tax=Penicillium flavigenum TaxID=254877 RepID=A0A1V6S9U0_9EURO|nr:hypothetical protein PENFLA_c084G01908 [Penicillium flavigenum]
MNQQILMCLHTTRLLMSSNPEQVPASLGQNQAMRVGVIIFIAIALYNALELTVLIALSFKTCRSVYFWSQLISTVLGMILASLGPSFRNFSLTPLRLTLLVSNIGFIMMVPTQSAILYLRLHLI